MIYILSIGVFAGLSALLTALLLVSEKLFADYGVCRLDINAGEEPLDVEGGQTLLSALYSSGIFIPSGCGGKGSCGHCKIRVLSGGGPVLPTELPFLDRKEIQNGIRLACQIKIREDIAVQIPEELLNIQMFTACVVDTRDLTSDIRQIRLQLEEPERIEFRPGQYVQVEVASDAGTEYRAYSISSPSGQNDEIELVVKLIPGGLASTYLHNVRKRDHVRFTGPYGDFVLSEDPQREIVCVGGGCGMAPMRSIIYSVYDRWPERTCWLFFGCRRCEDVFYLDEFRELERLWPNFHAVYALSDEVPDPEQWGGEKGMIHLALDRILAPGGRRQAFLCGPEPMIEAVTAVLTGKGVSKKDIFYDEF